MKYTFQQFDRQFPNNDACLDFIFNDKYGKLETCPKCNKSARFKRVYGRKSYQCQQTDCQHQIYPMAGTIFQKSTTPLLSWFRAMYLFTTTRNGVAAKEIERYCGVTYPTALRMAHQIKTLCFNKSLEKLKGEIIIDESFLGGLDKFKHNSQVKGRDGYVNKQPVFGMMEKDGTRVITKLVDEVTGAVLKPIIRENVDKDSIVVTDGFGAYAGLKKEYKQHEVINHMAGEYVHNGFSTNYIETYWSTLKRMIKGTHIHVSKKHLPKYLAENTFRFEHRKEGDKMFLTLIAKINSHAA